MPAACKQGHTVSQISTRSLLKAGPVGFSWQNVFALNNSSQSSLTRGVWHCLHLQWPCPLPVFFVHPFGSGCNDNAYNSMQGARTGLHAITCQILCTHQTESYKCRRNRQLVVLCLQNCNCWILLILPVTVLFLVLQLRLHYFIIFLLKLDFSYIVYTKCINCRHIWR